MKVKTALISVSDKIGIEEFGKGLQELGITIISTGNTAEKLIGCGVHVRRIEEVTNVPEMLEGRVKTLHPAIHGGILARRDKRQHMEELQKVGFQAIDLVVVNLYPFKETIANKHSSNEQIIENIDIGGVALIRAAAKNFEGVAIVVDKADYGKVLEELKKKDSELSKETLRYLAKKAFEETAAYDALIAQHFRNEFSASQPFSDKLTFTYEKLQDCRYGENPHQKAAFYKEPVIVEPCVSNAVQLNGKELSFNNINDANGAVELLKEFEDTATVIVKHANPCGVALGKNLLESFEKALASDPVSAFGGIIAFNRPVDLAVAQKVTSFFNEIVIAPAYDEAALEHLRTKKNLRVLRIENLGNARGNSGFDLKKVTGGMLVQDRDLAALEESQIKVASDKKASREQINQMLFAWTVAKHVKSNAIVLAKDFGTIGIGAGQMSRIDSAEIAIKKAGDKVKGSIMASDAFFPFRDCVDVAAKAGVTAIIQTGGSINDAESIKAANEHAVVLAFSGLRHFRH